MCIGGKDMVKMDNIYDIRQRYFIQGHSIRRINRETGYSRQLIRKTLTSEAGVPKYKLNIPRSMPVLAEFKNIIDEIIKNDQKNPHKQRHTAKKIFVELKNKHGYKGSDSTVRHYVGKQRKRLKEVYIRQEHPLGYEAQCDWGEATILLNGQKAKVQLFAMCLMGSGLRFVRAYPTQGQEAFFDGHVQAFEFFEGIPQIVRYDNLKTAVHKVLKGRNRVEQQAFIALKSHYIYEASFCNVAKGNEKGGVEALVKYAEQNFMVPLPEVNSLEELNVFLDKQCRNELERQIGDRPDTVQNLWDMEKNVLRPLPTHAFDPCKTRTCVVNHYATVQIDTNFYSVPSQHVALELTIKIYATVIEITCPDGEKVLHNRCFGRKQYKLIIDHFLNVLLKKPHALGNSTVLLSSDTPETFRHFFEAMGEKTGAVIRSFLDIIKLARIHGQEAVLQAMQKALEKRMPNLETVTAIVHKSIGVVAQEEEPAKKSSNAGIGDSYPKSLPRENLPECIKDIRLPAPCPYIYDALLRSKGGVA